MSQVFFFTTKNGKETGEIESENEKELKKMKKRERNNLERTKIEDQISSK